MLEKAIKSIDKIRREHEEVTSKHRYNPELIPHLGDIINPVLLKLTKEDDAVGMGKLGPIYSPPHYYISFEYTKNKNTIH